MYKILLLDTKKSNPNAYLVKSLERALLKHPKVSKVVISDYFSAIHDFVNFDCNTFFAFDGEEANTDICARLCALAKHSIIWFTEDPYERSVNVRVSKLFNLVLTNDVASVEYYGDNCHHLPLAACLDSQFINVREKNFFYDLFFAGTAWPNRVKVVQDIYSQKSDINFKLALPTNQFLPAFDLPIEKSFYNWKMPNNEFCKVSNLSFATLSLHRDFSASGNDSEAMTPGPRLFELMLSGAFQLVDQSIGGVDSYYVDGRDYISFENGKDCIEKLNYFLEKPEERNAIAREGQRKTQEFESYRNRVDSILELLEKTEQREKQSGHQSLQITPVEQKASRVLCVSHNIKANGNFGGVEVYQDWLYKKLQKEYEVIYLIPATNPSDGVNYQVVNSSGELLKEYALHMPPGRVSAALTSPHHDHMLYEVLKEYKIDLVHVQHLIGHVPSVAFVPKSLGIPSIFSVHDYFPVCVRFNLLNYEDRYCQTDRLSVSNCDVCLKHHCNAPQHSQVKRRNFFERVLQSFDVIHANSETTRNMVNSIFPSISVENIVTRGIPAPSQATNKVAKTKSRTNRLKIAILGNFTPNKGANYFIRLVNELRESQYEFVILGKISSPLDQILNALNLENVVLHDSYDASELETLLSDIDLTLHLSIWPETYCITLSEAWQNKAIPVVFDLGALGERVINGENGFKVETGDVGQIIDIIRQLSASPALREQIRGNISNNLWEQAQDHEAWMLETYKALVTKYNTRPATDVVEKLAHSRFPSEMIFINQEYWTSAMPRHEPLPPPVETTPVQHVAPVAQYQGIKGRAVSSLYDSLVIHVKELGFLKTMVIIVKIITGKIKK